jgi:hypothetical protein
VPNFDESFGYRGKNNQKIIQFAKNTKKSKSDFVEIRKYLPFPPILTCAACA